MTLVTKLKILLDKQTMIFILRTFALPYCIKIIVTIYMSFILCNDNKNKIVEKILC